MRSILEAAKKSQKELKKTKESKKKEVATKREEEPLDDKEQEYQLNLAI